ncbi:hypothetical protein AMS68_006848 [Peltaster fructicola]|uniref:Cupin type-1 domain-containing protein n=1 Tax=Peltaster fructicola TaxID=286661 RepID=A0A6H0Y350_9PEZI|nr:hypothetical protein AMS68_006848 [Peltaster fructicola]
MTGIAPLASLQVIRHIIPAYKLIPNSSAQNRPLLIYKSALPAAWSVADMEKHLTTIDVVVPQWRYTMYSQSHFHSTTHEVLAVAQGKAKLCFGHEDNPEHVMETVSKGDVIIIPAGVSHRLMEDHGDFLMVGSYPKGKQWDMCYGHLDEAKRIDAITNLPWFDRDPIYGNKGPVDNV